MSWSEIASNLVIFRTHEHYSGSRARIVTCEHGDLHAVTCASNLYSKYGVPKPVVRRISRANHLGCRLPDVEKGAISGGNTCFPHRFDFDVYANTGLTNLLQVPTGLMPSAHQQLYSANPMTRILRSWVPGGPLELQH